MTTVTFSCEFKVFQIYWMFSAAHWTFWQQNSDQEITNCHTAKKMSNKSGNHPIALWKTSDLSQKMSNSSWVTLPQTHFKTITQTQTGIQNTLQANWWSCPGEYFVFLSKYDTDLVSNLNYSFGLQRFCIRTSSQKSEGESEKDQRISDKHQRKFRSAWMGLKWWI